MYVCVYIYKYIHIYIKTYNQEYILGYILISENNTKSVTYISTLKRLHKSVYFYLHIGITCHFYESQRVS